MHKEVIFGCPEWAALSSQAKSLYWLLKGKRNPKKNGGLVRLSYRELLELKYHGLRRRDTISRAFKELESSGWIQRQGEGGGLFGRATIYKLTGFFDEYGFKRGEE